ncbi:MAG: hypothetical protein AAB870_02365 [Patescibacteria group bacterium]
MKKRFLKIISAILVAISVISCSTVTTPLGRAGSNDGSMASSSEQSSNSVTTTSTPLEGVPDVWPGFKACPTDPKLIMSSESAVCPKLMAALWPIRDKISTELPDGLYEAKSIYNEHSGDGNEWHLCSYVPVYVIYTLKSYSTAGGIALFLKDGRMVDIKRYLVDPNYKLTFEYDSLDYYDPIKKQYHNEPLYGKKRVLEFLGASGRDFSRDTCAFWYLRDYFKIPY